jgi:WhiB family redox-sensing transcriptional regulator
MGMHSVDAGYDTTRVTDRPDRALIEHRMRVLLSTIACEMFGVEVPDHIDENTVIPQTPASRAARAWRDEMYHLLDLTIPTTELESAPKPEPASVPTAPAANPTGQPRVITSIKLTDAADDNWRSRGACRDEDPELFFPIGDSGPALLQTEQAKAICRRCKVADECLSWALAGQPYGVAGGMSEAERAALKRRTAAHTVRVAA